jgi:hypothetical protein
MYADDVVADNNSLLSHFEMAEWGADGLNDSNLKMIRAFRCSNTEADQAQQSRLLNMKWAVVMSCYHTFCLQYAMSSVLTPLSINNLITAPWRYSEVA